MKEKKTAPASVTFSAGADGTQMILPVLAWPLSVVVTDLKAEKWEIREGFSEKAK